LQLSGRTARSIAIALGLAWIGAATARADGDWLLGLDTMIYDDTDNVTAVTPRLSVAHRLDDDGGRVGAYALVDAVSAASVDVISHATDSYVEGRTEAGFDLAKAFGDHLPSASYRFSIEPDYTSNGVVLGWQSRLGTPDSVLRADYGLTYDVVGRSGSSWQSFSRELFTHNANVTFTQTLGPETVLRGVYSLTVQQGYLEKPYRMVPMFGAATLANAPRITLSNFDQYQLPARPPEEVPDVRVGHAIGLRLLQSIDDLRGSIRVDYQLYFDDWSLTAHTAEVALTATVADGIRLVPYGRFYLQTAASFFRREYIVDAAGQIPQYRTLDRDLGSYHSITGGGRLEWTSGEWGGYLDGALMWTHYDDFLLLDDRVAAMGQVGLRWSP
jgi:hypothetical protein